jgi:Ca2+-binding EF-hand superfamily protein
MSGAAAFSVLHHHPHQRKTDVKTVVDKGDDITLDVLRKSIRWENPAITEEQIKSIFDLMDMNKDGNVSKKEFLHRYTLNRSRFMEADTDKNGTLSFEELRAFILRDNIITEEQIKLIFDRMDRNKNGTVDQNEFNHCYSLYITQKQSAMMNTEYETKVLTKEEVQKELSPERPNVRHMGVVKKRGQMNKSYKTRFFVLTDAMFEYYLDENSYFVEKEGGLRGSISARDMKVTTATKSGHDKTRDGYHFTIENTSNGKVVECACEDAEGREMWLQTIQACIEASDAVTGYPMPPDSEAFRVGIMERKFMDTSGVIWKKMCLMLTEDVLYFSKAEDSQRLVLDFIYTRDLNECEVKSAETAAAATSSARPLQTPRTGKL